VVWSRSRQKETGKLLSRYIVGLLEMWERRDVLRKDWIIETSLAEVKLEIVVL
jgi:hypothetical protein